MRRELETKLEQLSPLLRSEEHWDQAVELLVSLDEPDLWKAVLDGMDERHLDRRIVGLLARMPDDAPGVAEKRRSYRIVRLNSNSLLDARLTPNIERVTFVRTSFGPGSESPEWLAELAKLERLKELDLNGGRLGDPELLALPRLERLRLSQLHLFELPDLPSLRRLRMTEARGPCHLGRYESLEELELERSPLPTSDALGAMLRLRRLRMSYYVEQTLEDIEPLLHNGTLETLSLGGRRLVSIERLRSATRMRHLTIHDSPLEEIEALSELRELQTIMLARTKVKSLEPLRQLRELREIDLSGNEWLVSLDPLRKLPHLKKLVLRATPFTPANVPDELRGCAQWPRLDPSGLFR